MDVLVAFVPMMLMTAYVTPDTDDADDCAISFLISEPFACANAPLDIPSFRGGIDHEEMPCPRNHGISIRTSRTVRSVSCWSLAGRVAEIARELDVHQGTLANWVHKARASQKPGALGESERLGAEKSV